MADEKEKTHRLPLICVLEGTIEAKSISLYGALEAMWDDMNTKKPEIDGLLVENFEVEYRIVVREKDSNTIKGEIK